MVWKIGTRVFLGGDYFTLLEIAPNASDEDIIKSYRQLALRFHSDKSDEDSEMFHRLEEAKRVLLDPELRRCYESERDKSDDRKLYHLYGKSKSKSTNASGGGGMPELKCGSRLSQDLKCNLAKWRKMFKNSSPRVIVDNVESSLKDCFTACENNITEEMKRIDEMGHQYLCRICKRNFSSEDEHYDVMMGEYSDWILDADVDTDVSSNVFAFLRNKFYSETETLADVPSSASSQQFCWTDDMFQSQLLILGTLLDENHFQRANATSFGILMEIEKMLNGHTVHLQTANVEEFKTTFVYLYQLIKTRFKNDGYSAIIGYRALFQTYPDFMIHPLAEIIHEFIISKLLEDKAGYARSVGGLHFLLWKYCTNDDAATIDSDKEFDDHVDTFGEKSDPLIRSIIDECFKNIDFEALSELLQIILPCNTTALEHCLRTKVSTFNIDMETDFENLRGEYKPMFLMIRATMSKLNGKYDDAQCQLASALDSCSDVHFQYREVIPKAVARLMVDYEFHKFIVSRKLCDDSPVKVIPDINELETLRKFNIWSQQSTRSVIYNVAKQNEESIRSRFNSKPDLEKAFAFLDFSQGVDLLSGRLAALIHAVHYLMAELSTQNELRELLTLQKAIEYYSSVIFFTAMTSCSPDTQIYVKRFVAAAQIKLGISLKEKIDRMKKDLNGTELRSQEKIPIMSEVSLVLLNQSTKDVLKLSKIVPFTTTPLLSVQDNVLSAAAYRSMVQHFIVQKSNISTAYATKSECISNALFPPHIYSHEKLDAMWKGWGDEDILPNFESCRHESMQQFLTSKNWTFDHVEDLMCWPMLRRTEGGWLNNEEWNLSFPDSEPVFKTFGGFDLNKHTGELVLYLIPSDNDDDGLFTSSDVEDVLECGITDAHFTLKDPDSQFRVHPFQEFSYHPPTLTGTDYLMTMLHADYFLKQITTGVEVNGLAPWFHTRPSSEGFLQRYSPDMQAILRPIMERVRDPIEPLSEIAHRFWIEAGEVDVDITEDTGDWTKFRLNSPNMMVKTKKMKKLPNGELVDDVEGIAHTAEQQLANNMTIHYDEIGLKFPLLLRLKELTKISAMCRILQSKAEISVELESALRSYGTVSYTTNEYITGRESNIRDSIIDFRNSIISKVASPVYSEWRVEEHFQEVLAANNLRGKEHLVASHEISRVKASIRNQLHEADEHRTQNCVDQLFVVYDLPKTPAMRALFPNFLAGDWDKTDTIVSECQKNWRVKELNRVQTFLRGLQDDVGVNMSKHKFDGLTNDPMTCSWVPATFCSEFKPPVEYDFESVESDQTEEPSKGSNQSHKAENGKEDGPAKLLSSLEKTLAIDDKPAKLATPEQISSSASESNYVPDFEDETGEKDNEPELEHPESEQKESVNECTRRKPSRVYGGISLSTVLNIVSAIPQLRGLKTINYVAKAAKRSRAGRGKRIRDIGKDPKTPKHHRGWIQQELNQIERGKRKYIRNPRGTEMAHPRGKESAKGHDYSETYLQDIGLHRLQHKHDKMGTLNKPK